MLNIWRQINDNSNWSLGNKLQWNFNQNAYTFSFRKGYLEMSSSKYRPVCPCVNALIHWGRVTHICVSELTIIGSVNGLSPGRRQAIIWNNDGLLLIEPLGTNFNRNSNIFIQENALEHVVCEMASILTGPQCVNESVPINQPVTRWADMPGNAISNAWLD